MSIEALKRLVAAVEAIPEDVEGWMPDALTDALIDAKKAIADAEKQEPCGWQFYQDGKWHNGLETNNHRANTEASGIPVRDVYTHPQPKREWVGLTEGERAECWYGPNCHEPKSPHDDYAMAIEAKLKQKNAQ